jgi:DNA polymerase
MDNRRLQVLKAMDVDVWVRRTCRYRSKPASTPSPEFCAEPAAAAPEMPPDVPDNRVAQMGWDELANIVRDCTLCQLHTTRTQTVFGVGDRRAEWMVIGEAPGADEDKQGEPFVGRRGAVAQLHVARRRVSTRNGVHCQCAEMPTTG